MTKPLLLVDVDGVLNVFYASHRQDLEEHTALKYTIYTSPKFGEWLLSLTDLYDLVWATTWEDDANKWISPLVGLPSDLPVIHMGSKNFDNFGTWKLPNIQKYVGEYQAFAWLDDDLWEDADNWVKSREGKGLLIRVNPMTGLTERHIEMLREWANAKTNNDQGTTGEREVNLGEGTTKEG